MYSELTNDTQSSGNKHFIMSIYAVCFSVIKSCTYLDSSTLQALHEHACLFYEKCNVDRVDKMRSNITVYDVEIKIKYSHLNQVPLRWYGTLHMYQKVCLNLVKKDQLCAITLMNRK